MATIVIKDLPDNVDLDRQAMRAVTGGARARAAAAPARRVSHGERIAAHAEGLREARVQTPAQRPTPSLLFR